MVPSIAEVTWSADDFCDAISTSSTHEDAQMEKKANMAAHVGRTFENVLYMVRRIKIRYMSIFIANLSCGLQNYAYIVTCMMQNQYIYASSD